MKEHKGQFYAVDGESFANGKVRDAAITYEYDDIYLALLDALVEGSDTIHLDEELYVDAGEFLDKSDLKELKKKLNMMLFDCDYGSKEHKRLVSIFLDQHLSPSITYETEYQEYV